MAEIAHKLAANICRHFSLLSSLQWAVAACLLLAIRNEKAPGDNTSTVLVHVFKMIGCLKL